MIIGRESKKQFTLRIALHMKKPHNFCCDTCKRIFLLIKKTISANFLYLRKRGSQHELHSSLQSNPTMEKGEPSNVSYEEFEPFCKWKKLEDSDVLEVHLPGIIYQLTLSSAFSLYYSQSFEIQNCTCKQTSRKKN